MLRASGIMGWSLGSFVPTQGSVMVSATAIITFFALSQALVRGLGITTFITPVESGQGISLNG